MICKKCGTPVQEGKKFCPKCGSIMEVENNNSQGVQQAPYNNMGMQYFQPKKKSKLPKILIVIGILVVIAIVAIALAGGDEEQVKNTDPVGKAYIELVRNGYPVYLEDKLDEYDLSYGTAFASFFADGEWEYFVSKDGYKVVEYKGGCTYNGESVEAQVQFTIDDDEQGFERYITLIDGEEYDMDAFIETVFNNYIDEN